MSRAKPKRKASKRAKPKMTNVTLHVDRNLHDVLQLIAEGASTDLSTVAQVLMIMAVQFGKKIGEASQIDMLRGKVQALEAQLDRARVCMEANDHQNAREIFGPPLEGKPA
jgi:hypothetical protein